MKAKQYAEEYNALVAKFSSLRPDLPILEVKKDVLGAIALKFVGELHALSQARHIQTEAGWLGLFNELDDKWRAFARQSGDDMVSPVGFEVILSGLDPHLVAIWKDLRARNGQPATQPIPGDDWDEWDEWLEE